MSSLIFPTALLGCIVEGREPYVESQIDTSTGGREYRSTWWTQPRWRYRLKFDVLRSVGRTELQALTSFFGRHFGSWDSFLIVDPEDNQVTDHGFGVGDGATTGFQLQRTPLGDNAYDPFGGPWLSNSKPRTNLCVRSEAFDDAAWTKTGVTVAANSTIAPDGNVTADTITASAGAGNHYIFTGPAGTAGATYALDFFVKKNGSNSFVMVGDGGDAAWHAVTFNFDTQLYSTPTNCTALTPVALGNGWFRIGLTFTRTNATTINPFVVAVNAGNLASPNYVAAGTEAVYAWGAMLELGATGMTPYISTAAAAVTVSPTYYPGIGDSFEPITEVAPGPTIFVNGVAKTQVTDYAITFSGGTSPGVITFGAAPAANAVLSWTGAYWRRVRFEEQRISFERIVNQMATAGVPLISVK